VVIQIGPCVILYQKLCCNSNRSVRGTLEVAVVVEGIPCAIIYQRLCCNSNRSLRGDLAVAVCYLKSVHSWYFSRGCVVIQIGPGLVL
jgi:hypothetical protein